MSFCVNFLIILTKAVNLAKLKIHSMLYAISGGHPSHRHTHSAHTHTHIQPPPHTHTHTPIQAWLVSKRTVFGMKLPTRFQLIGQVSLADYEKWITWFKQNQLQDSKQASPITSRVYARSAGFAVEALHSVQCMLTWLQLTSG